jgi:MarR family transcriptional regulator, transcriptional regulator for hemolysin
MNTAYDRPVPPPREQPIGLALSRAARVVSRAFDEALAGAGGSRPIWLILISLKAQPRANQRALAEAVGITDATLTHHLNAMESAGLLSRRRDPANRRVHLVELTDEGQAMFQRLRGAAGHFDARLHASLSEGELRQLRDGLDRLAANAIGDRLELP